MAEKMKKGPSEAGRKTLKCPHKQGINLNMREQKGNPRLTLLVGCLAIAILAGCVAKFGVIDQYRRLDAAQAAYASVHTEYTQMQELLKGYDRLLMEYRTYSMEWATDGSEDNGTLVDRQKALDLLEQVHFAVIRGNISEIKTLAQGSGKTRGVDADLSDAVTEDNLEAAAAFAKEVAARFDSVVAITGAIDLAADKERCFVIRNGRPEMGKITGTGCQLSALTAAFVTANPGHALDAAAAAVCAMGLAGEIAHKRLTALDGNSSYRNYIIDAIYNMTPEQLEKGANYEVR